MKTCAASGRCQVVIGQAYAVWLFLLNGFLRDRGIGNPVSAEELAGFEPL